MVTFIESTDNVFPEDLCARIIEYYDRLSSHSKLDATSAKHVYELCFDLAKAPNGDWGIQSNQNLPAIPENDLQALLETLDKPISDYFKKYYRLESNLETFTYELCHRIEFKIKHYRKDIDHYDGYHEDFVLEEPRRRLTALIYLNDVDEGGVTEFYHYDIKGKPRCGSLLLFPPYVTHLHRATMPKSNDKYLMNIWFYY